MKDNQPVTKHIVLFVLTIVTTLMAGASQQQINIFKEPWMLYKGIPFSFTLIAILLTHELGHYFLSRKHHVDATLPYFIPLPPIPNVLSIGTLGAVIKMRSPLRDKRSLLDVGVAGPLAGFVVSVIALTIGIKLSSLIAVGETMRIVLEDGRIVETHMISEGNSLIYLFLKKWYGAIFRKVMIF